MDALCHVHVSVYINQLTAIARDLAIPVMKFTLPVSPGSIVTMHLMETIGSKTEPSLSESFVTPVIVTGSGTVFPLPTNLERSVSK